METRLLVLNSDPVFQDTALAIFDEMATVENRIVRTLSEAIDVLLRETFNLFVVEGEAGIAVEQAVEVRQHFPSLEILCLTSGPADRALGIQAEEQKFTMFSSEVPVRQLRRRLGEIVSNFAHREGAAAEGIDPCHSLVGNLNQFSAAEILQMSCMGQRSGRFIFKSGRGNSEIYLQHGMIRHAVYGSLEGEAAVAEVFRWRQGRFYFEEGIISQLQTVDRPWAHLLLDNLQQLDETLEVANAREKS